MPVAPIKPETVRLVLAPWHHGKEVKGEQRAFCPLCEDPKTSSTPSASINADENKWYCQKGSHGGNIRQLVREMKNAFGFDFRAARLSALNKDPQYDANRRAAVIPTSASTLPDKAALKRHTEMLLKSGNLAKLQEERGFDVETIKQFQIGWDGFRYTFPVFDAEGVLVNVRRYKMGSDIGKMQNVKGCGTPARLYGIEDLANFDTIVIAEGETDRLLLKQHLRIAGNTTIGVVTSTHGAGTFLVEWTRLFVGKKVYVCYDADEAGVNGAAKISAMLKPAALAIYTVVIPLSEKGSDITDFLYEEDHKLDEFIQLMAESEGLPTAVKPKTPEKDEPAPQHGEKMSLDNSFQNQNISKIVELVVSVSGRGNAPTLIPKVIEAICGMDKGSVCGACPVAFSNGNKIVNIDVDDPNINEFVDVSLIGQMKAAKDRTGARCSSNVEIKIIEDQRCEQLIVQPSIDERSESESHTDTYRNVWSIGTHHSNVNEKIRLVGTTAKYHKDSSDRLQAWVNERVDADIDKFKLNHDIREELETFGVRTGQSPLDRCIEIANDMAENITHIYDRPLLHVGYDLVWHSVLGFSVQDTPVDKGWLEMMVVGDTRTGKSTVAKRLISHYRTGRFTSCEQSSLAGIVGGTQPINGSWTTTWGIIPMNDRRLVVLDEVSGAKVDMISQMSSIRSDGIARITMISGEQTTSARTRLIWITNPMTGMNIADDADLGMGVLRSVVPNNEDIARFDFVLAAQGGEVDNDVINSLQERSNPGYSSQACENLVKWAWSLKRSDVRISSSAIKTASEEAKKMKDEYINDPPLIQSADVRYKILRIACALAARTFSERNGKLIVDKIHVIDAVRFLNLIYGEDYMGRDAMGYRRKSQRVIYTRKVAASRRVSVKASLLENNDVLDALLELKGAPFSQRNFMEATNTTQEKAQTAVKEFTRNRMLHRTKRGLIMDEVLVSILRELEDEDIQL